MKDTSEFTDATEQAKPTRNRTSARSKSENIAPSSQEQQETKPAPRRRTASATSGATTARTAKSTESTPATTTHTAKSTENASAPATPKAKAAEGTSAPATPRTKAAEQASAPRAKATEHSAPATPKAKAAEHASTPATPRTKAAESTSAPAAPKAKAAEGTSAPIAPKVTENASTPAAPKAAEQASAPTTPRATEHPSAPAVPQRPAQRPGGAPGQHTGTTPRAPGSPPTQHRYPQGPATRNNNPPNGGGFRPNTYRPPAGGPNQGPPRPGYNQGQGYNNQNRGYQGGPGQQGQSYNQGGPGQQGQSYNQGGPGQQGQGQSYGTPYRPYPSGQVGTPTAPRGAPPAGSRSGPAGGRGAPAGGRGAPAGGRGAPAGQRPPYRSGGPSSSGARPQGNRPSTARRPAPSSRSQERRTAAVKEKPSGPLYIPPQIVVKDLAELLKVSPVEVIRMLIKHGVFANINQVVDYEPAANVAKDLGYEPNSTPPQAQASAQVSASEAMVATREEHNTIHIPPVVTIMGHVDHGKTSLLDVIRKTKVAAGEAGGITQHIGAYQVEINNKKITFLDTPGHEAFTAMRARGAQTAHIAIIVVAADDGVMPQTREAIDHALAAKMPIIIALNKMDKVNANPDHVKQQLAEIGIVVEEYGGEIICVPVSARKAEGIDELLEYILLVAELQDIRANPNRLATGVIIEAKLERSSGPTATVLVQQGTLKMGDNFVVGSLSGKVRAMFNDRGKRIQKALPSTPVSILGLPEVPQAGDHLEVTLDERISKQKAQEEAERRRTEASTRGQVSLDTLYVQMQEGSIKELNVVLKSDVQGSAEAVKSSLTKLGEDNLKVRMIHEGVGNISETDVHLAAASGAIIIGFNVKADATAQREAQRENVDIRYYEVIYKLIDDIQAALKGLLEPTLREVILGHAEVLQTFSSKKIVIAGCRITDGKLVRSSSIRVMRQGNKVFDGPIASLRRGKDDVREVLSGYECGVLLDGFNEFEVGDILEAYTQERVKPGA